MAGNSKIPSIIYYDTFGNMKAAGAEADGASVLAQAEDEGWIKTELYATSFIALLCKMLMWISAGLSCVCDRSR